MDIGFIDKFDWLKSAAMRAYIDFTLNGKPLEEAIDAEATPEGSYGPSRKDRSVIATIVAGLKRLDEADFSVEAATGMPFLLVQEDETEQSLQEAVLYGVIELGVAQQLLPLLRGIEHLLTKSSLARLDEPTNSPLVMLFEDLEDLLNYERVFFRTTRQIYVDYALRSNENQG